MTTTLDPAGLLRLASTHSKKSLLWIEYAHIDRDSGFARNFQILGTNVVTALRNDGKSIVQFDNAVQAATIYEVLINQYSSASSPFRPSIMLSLPDGAVRGFHEGRLYSLKAAA